MPPYDHEDTLQQEDFKLKQFYRKRTLILMEDWSSKSPLVLSRSYHVSETSLHIPWKKLVLAKDNAMLLQTMLLWDPRQQVETLITLNDKCQITLLQAAITRQRYGRTAWRRAH